MGTESSLYLADALQSRITPSFGLACTGQHKPGEPHVAELRAVSGPSLRHITCILTWRAPEDAQQEERGTDLPDNPL